MFEAYLPYAIALDVENEWGEQFALALGRVGGQRYQGSYEPGWFHSDYRSWPSPGAFATDFAPTFGQSVVSSLSPPASTRGAGLSGGGFGAVAFPAAGAAGAGAAGGDRPVGQALALAVRPLYSAAIRSGRAGTPAEQTDHWEAHDMSRDKVVLAYSGGLDTSIILRWLAGGENCEVVTFTADIGQGEELEPARKKAR